MERATGFEPASSAWKAKALPLDDTRIVKELAPMAGVEPAGRGFGDRTSTTASPAQIGVADGT
jgi:hypothetical protein